MAGQPGRSGGWREGAGRPPATTTLKTGDQWIVRIGETQQLGAVKIIRRGVIEITLADGETVRIFK
jgi:hypothetical protein